MNWEFIYVIEATILICLIIIFSSSYKKGKKKSWLIYCIIGIIILVIIEIFIEKPKIYINNNSIIEAEAGLEIKIPKTMYHCRNITEKVNIIGMYENKVGEYDVKLKVKTSIGYYEKFVKIKVTDTIPPEITLKGEEQYTIEYGKKYVEPGYSATDINDGDVTSKVKVSRKKIDDTTYNVIYEVEDNYGNKNSVIRKIKIVDAIEKKAEQGNDGEPGTVYLTFDDGPSSAITPKILDILKKKNVKATFFILDYDSKGETLVKREIEEGHTVGIHGYSHNYKEIYKSVDAYMKNITKLQKKIKKSTGYNATITRFPGGSSNTISRYNPKIMTKLSKEVVKRGYKYFDWNITSGDAGDVKTADEMYKNVIKNLSKKRINVVLMHDFSSNKKILEALPKIIDYSIEHGYKFSNITVNTPMVTHKINN